MATRAQQAHDALWDEVHQWQAVSAILAVRLTDSGDADEHVERLQAVREFAARNGDSMVPAYDQAIATLQHHVQLAGHEPVVA